MKNSILFKLSTVLMIMALCIASCGKAPVGDDSGNGNGGNNGGNESNNEDGNNDTPNTELVVPVNLTGEILNPETPVSNTTENNLYYIQAYTIDEEGGFIPYAHELFNKTEDIKITLDEEKQYKFFATMVMDGKQQIKVHDGIYGMPFMSGLTNDFITDNHFDRYGICYGYADQGLAENYSMPSLDRYYGESEIYTINSDNPSPITINMIRTVFGLKVIVENLNQGQLLINMSESPTMKISSPESEISGIFSFDNLNEVFDIDARGKTEFTNEYTQRITVKIKQIDNEGLEIPVSDEVYDFYRNKIRTLKVIIDQGHSNGITVTTETTPMQSDEQGEIEFVGGGGIIRL